MGLDSFKWVLYGDDDTVFFVDGALDMLENLDYNMPYLLSDDVWFVEDDGKHGFLLPCRMHASYPLHSACNLVQAVLLRQIYVVHLGVFCGLSSS